MNLRADERNGSVGRVRLLHDVGMSDTGGVIGRYDRGLTPGKEQMAGKSLRPATLADLRAWRCMRHSGRRNLLGARIVVSSRYEPRAAETSDIMRSFTRTTLVGALAQALVLTTSFGQQRLVPAAEPAHVMILGTYHFANPGLDVVKTEVADILSTDKQAEVEEIVEALASFRPTKVAVEVRPPSRVRLDSLYRAYRGGNLELDRNEVQQLGFRIAARLGHERVYGVDHEGHFPFGAMMEYAEEHDPAFVAWVNERLAAIGAESNRQQHENTVVEILRMLNDPAKLAEDHGLYTEFAGVGAGDTYVGADLLAGWYERNIRTFADLRALGRPGERVLVIIGAGHAPILRELVTYHPAMTLVEPNDYLPGYENVGR